MASNLNISDLKKINREELSTLLLTAPNDDSVVVIDVRDSDHIGGHIKSSRHVPSGSLDTTAPELARQLRDAPRVVFHCALSQQRGPKAALKYLRERERLFPGLSTNTAGSTHTTEDAIKEEQEGAKKQEVLVLEGGFVKWQEAYGNDERLTENYNAELWADGY